MEASSEGKNTVITHYASVSDLTSGVQLWMLEYFKF